MERFEKWRARCVMGGKVFWITVTSPDGTHLSAARAVRDVLGNSKVKFTVRPVYSTKIIS